MRHNIYAYTVAGIDPPYVSMNREEDGRITLHVRGAKLGAAPAPEVQIEIPQAEFDKLGLALFTDPLKH